MNAKVTNPGWVGGYTLLRVLGTGGTGTVWEAEDEGGTRVALKLLHPSVAATEEARARLLREARLVNQVRSNRVSRVLDVEADDYSPFVVTELVRGKTLEDEISRAVLTPEDGAILASELAEILSDVHEAGIAHRDLKPSNVILAPDGPTLIDFGIAHGEGDPHLTQTGAITGTPGYVSPELLASPDDPALATLQEGDWYAWAALLLKSLTGRPPFGSGMTDLTLQRVMEGDPDVEDLNQDMRLAFRWALHPDPEKRMEPYLLVEVLNGSLHLIPDSEGDQPAPPPATGAETAVLEATPTQVQPQWEAPGTYGLPNQPIPAAPHLADTGLSNQTTPGTGPSYPQVGAPGSVPVYAQGASPNPVPTYSQGDNPSAVPTYSQGANPGAMPGYQGFGYAPTYATPPFPLSGLGGAFLSIVFMALLAWLPVFWHGWGVFVLVVLLMFGQVVGALVHNSWTRQVRAASGNQQSAFFTAVTTPWSITLAVLGTLPGLLVAAVPFYGILLVGGIVVDGTLDMSGPVDWLFGQDTTWTSPVMLIWIAGLMGLSFFWLMPTSRQTRLGYSRIASLMAPNAVMRFLLGLALAALAGFCGGIAMSIW